MHAAGTIPKYTVNTLYAAGTIPMTIPLRPVWAIIILQMSVLF